MVSLSGTKATSVADRGIIVFFSGPPLLKRGFVFIKNTTKMAPDAVRSHAHSDLLIYGSTLNHLAPHCSALNVRSCESGSNQR